MSKVDRAALEPYIAEVRPPAGYYAMQQVVDDLNRRNKMVVQETMQVLTGRLVSMGLRPVLLTRAPLKTRFASLWTMWGKR